MSIHWFVIIYIDLLYYCTIPPRGQRLRHEGVLLRPPPCRLSSLPGNCCVPAARQGLRSKRSHTACSLNVIAMLFAMCWGRGRSEPPGMGCSLRAAHFGGFGKPNPPKAKKNATDRASVGDFRNERFGILMSSRGCEARMAREGPGGPRKLREAPSKKIGVRGSPERRIFPGRVGKGACYEFSFPSRPGPARPGPTRPDPTRPDPATHNSRPQTVDFGTPKI